MKFRTWMWTIVLCLFTALAMSVWAAAQDNPSHDPSSNAPPMLGIQWAKGTALDQMFNRHSSPNMTYHRGKIMTTAVTGAIFWGTSWGTYQGDKIDGIDSWYQGFTNSNYAKTSDEYTGSNGQVGPTTTYIGHYIDTSPASDGRDSSVVLAEVCKMITNPDPAGNGYYAVYSDLGRGTVQGCAYHSYGTCGGVSVQFAFFWNPDGDTICGKTRDTSGLHSQGLAGLADFSGHELSEARTDPAANPQQGTGGWYDSTGAENGDKCVWTYPVPLVTFSNGTQWKIQGEWSNAAYTAGTGYPNSSGEKGCISGQ